ETLPATGEPLKPHNGPGGNVGKPNHCRKHDYRQHRRHDVGVVKPHQIVENVKLDLPQLLRVELLHADPSCFLVIGKVDRRYPVARMVLMIAISVHVSTRDQVLRAVLAPTRGGKIVALHWRAVPADGRANLVDRSLQLSLDAGRSEDASP